jgi:hypothetical protein
MKQELLAKRGTGLFEQQGEALAGWGKESDSIFGIVIRPDAAALGIEEKSGIKVEKLFHYTCRQFWKVAHYAFLKRSNEKNVGKILAYFLLCS